MRRILTISLLIISTAGIAGGGVYAWQSAEFSTEKTVLEGDNASLRLQVRQLEEQLTKKPEAKPAPPPAPAAAPTAAAGTDSDQVVQLIKADCAAQNGVDVSKGTFNLVKIDANFAKVDFNCAGSPATNRGILKKSAGAWVIIYKLSPAPSRTIIQRYGIPAEFR
jgi:hypothetical protein